MSKLIKKLNCVRQPEPQPMGFVSINASSPKSRMQIIALVGAEILENAEDLLKTADGLFLESHSSAEIKAIEKYCQSGENIPAGIRLKDVGDKSLKKALDSSCDFLVFDASAPVSLTKKAKIGRVLDLDINLGEGMLRTVSDLPVDAVMLSVDSGDSSLTVRHLMLLQRVAGMVNKPLLVSVSDEISQSELQSLWDMGICGLVVGLSDQKSIEKLKNLRENIAKLEAPAFRKKPKMTAILPQTRLETSEVDKEDDDDGEEEEDE
jgi:hypothetical protein